MGWGQIGWVLFLAGLPLSHFLTKAMDLWHTQAMWADLWVGLLFLSSLMVGIKIRPNRPLGAWAIWVFLNVGWLWHILFISKDIYPLPLLMPTLHLLTILLFWIAASAWDIPQVERLMTWVARIAVVVSFYGLLQCLNLDQFFADRDLSNHKDALVGTIGNSSHFATYLALTLPVMLIQRGKVWKGLVGLNMVLLLLTKSISGQFAAFCGLVWMAWHLHRRWLWGLGLVGLIALGYVWCHHDVINPHGRLAAWKVFFTLFHMKPITGFGPGFILELSKQIPSDSPIFQWRHVHNEPFQVALEQGVIGLGLMGWAVWESWAKVWRAQKTPLLIALSAMWLVFLLNSLTNFPGHLWMLSSLGLLAYCGIHTLTES